jgi:CrcB protein
MRKLVIVCSGGALGARYFLTSTIAERASSGPPWGTLLVNATGSFLIAAVMTLALATGLISADLRMFLTTGVMGGYTTYSSFNYETLRFMERGAWRLVAAYVGLTVGGCFFAGSLLLATARAAMRVGGGRAKE